MTFLNSKFGIPNWEGEKSDKSTIPAPETLTGTISHTNGTVVVTGTGTKFMSELQDGQYIYANDVVRRIEQRIDDTRLLVKSTFGANLSNVDLKMSRPGIYRKVSIKNTGANDGTLFGNDFPAGETVNFFEEAGLTPIVYDAQTVSTTFLISTQE